MVIAAGVHVSQSDDISRVARAAMVMERMVNQNTFDGISQGQLLIGTTRD